MSNRIVRVAFETRLANWAAGRTPPLDPSTQLAWQNVSFTPPASRIYLAGHLMPATPANPSLGTAHTRYQGIYQVDIHVPSGAGPGFGESLADEVEKLFSAGLAMTSAGRLVRVVGTPYVAAGIPDDDGYFIPVRIRYRSDVIG